MPNSSQPNFIVPTPAAGDSSNRAASTEFVSVAIASAITTGGGVPAATLAEALGGTATGVYMSPLRTRESLTAVIATLAEATGGTSNATFMTPLRTRESLTAVIATLAEATGGTSNATFMTPLRTRESLTAIMATVAQATAAISTSTLMAPYTTRQSLFRNRIIDAEWEYGVKGDAGATDNTAAMNAIIAYANGTSNVTVNLPPGDIYCGSSLTTIVANGLYFVGLGEMNNSRLIHTTSNFMNWSSSCQFSGCVNLGFANVGATTAITHVIDGSYIYFDRTYIGSNIGQFAYLGTAAIPSYVTFDFLTGVVNRANPIPLIKMKGGVNIVFRDCDVRPGDFGAGALNSERWFLDCVPNGSIYIDLTRFENCDLSEWSGLIRGVVTGSTAMGPIVIEGGVYDSLVNGGISISVATSSWLNKLVMRSAWMKVDGGSAVSLGGAGYLFGIQIDNSFILGETATTGVAEQSAINISGTGNVEDIQINNTKIVYWNIDNATTAGIQLGGGANWRNVNINGGIIGANDSGFSQLVIGTSTMPAPTYGVLIQGAIQNFKMSNVFARGRDLGLYVTAALDSPTYTGNTFVSDASPTAPVTMTAPTGSPMIIGNAVTFDCAYGTGMWTGAGGQINFANGDVVVTHSTNLLTFTGATNGYKFDEDLLPTAAGTASLGNGSLSWASLDIASGGNINFGNGDVTITHSVNTLTFTGAASGYFFDTLVSAGTASGFYMGSVPSVKWAGGYNQIYDPGGTVGISIGSTDPTNYYDNTTHQYRSRSAAASIAQIGATGIVLAQSQPLVSGGTTGFGIKISTAANFGIFVGTGVPTMVAGTNSMYLRSDGSSATTRIYVNTNGSTTWTAVLASG